MTTPAWMPALLAAMIQVESAGDWSAVGDGGRSHGGLQIGVACIVDVNRVYGTAYTLADAGIEARARQIATLYMLHWARRSGRAITPELCARIWNGGPSGYVKAATVGYWEKVRSAMEQNDRGEATYD
jgi:hypothetical protein